MVSECQALEGNYSDVWGTSLIFGKEDNEEPWSGLLLDITSTSALILNFLMSKILSTTYFCLSHPAYDTLLWKLW